MAGAGYVVPNDLVSSASGAEPVGWPVCAYGGFLRSSQQMVGWQDSEVPAGTWCRSASGRLGLADREPPFLAAPAIRVPN